MISAFRYALVEFRRWRLRRRILKRYEAAKRAVARGEWPADLKGNGHDH